MKIAVLKDIDLESLYDNITYDGDFAALDYENINSQDITHAQWKVIFEELAKIAARVAETEEA